MLFDAFGKDSCTELHPCKHRVTRTCRISDAKSLNLKPYRLRLRRSSKASTTTTAPPTMLMRSTTGSDWVLCHEMALIGTNNTDDGRPPASPTSSDTITCSSSFRRTPKSQARVEITNTACINQTRKAGPLVTGFQFCMKQAAPSLHIFSGPAF